MKSAAALLAALLALTPAAALAQETPAPAPAPAPAQAPPARSAPSPEAVAAARAEADRLIAQAGAQDLFTNITDDGLPRVRHDRSGLECSFNPGDRSNKIIVYNAGGIPRGDDVSCTTVTAEVLQTLYATRYNPPIDTRQAITDAVAAIRHRWPDLKWYEGVNVSMQPDRTGRAPLPQTVLAHYIVTVDGVKSYTQARVALHNGWMFKERVTVAEPETIRGQLVAEMTWTVLLLKLVDGASSI